MATNLLNRKKGRDDAVGSSILDGGDLYQVEEFVPRTDLDLREKNIRKAKVIKWLLVVLLCAVPLSLFAGCQAQISSSDLSKKVTAAQSESASQQVSLTVSDPGKFAAYQSLQAWLASVPNPLPGGQIVSWDGSVKPADFTTSKVSRMTENFTVVDGAGRGYTAAFQVAIDPRGGAQTVAGPSLVPVISAATDGWAQDQTPWPGIQANTQVSDSVSAAVNSWAKAYTSGDPDQLRLAVGDTNAADSYVPMSGVASVETQATASTTTKEGLVVRAQVVLHWAGRSANTSTQPLEFDLLVLRADTAAPQVVAWGAPGSGLTAKPYQNAIQVPADLESTPTASASPSSKSYDTAGASAPAPAPTSVPTSKVTR